MITVNQLADQLTMVNSDLVYVLTSDSSSRSQFQYITYIQDSSSTTLTTIKQQPNPSSKGVFDIGRISKQYEYYDTYAPLAGSGSTNDLFNKQTEAAKIFKIRFGEEWGTSSTSSVTTSSVTTTGSVPYYYWINGVIDPNYGAWGWNTSSYYKPQTTPSSATFNYNVGMTIASRTQYCQIEDYLTVGLLNGSLDGSSTVAQDIYCYRLEVYNSGSKVYDDYVPNIGSAIGETYGGPRTNFTQLWSDVTSTPTGSKVLGKQTENTLLMYAGIGPGNLTINGNYFDFTQAWDYYTVTFLSQQAASTPNNNGVWDKFTIYKQDPNCGYETVRFMWINEMGVWDYYNFTLAKTDTYELEKATYKKNFVDYSTSTTSPYNIRRRGTEVFDTKISQTYTVNSDWLTQQESDWLVQLFYSPQVFIQDGLDIIPIWIDTTEVITKSNVRTQKLFTYKVSYKLSNQKRSR